MLKMVIRMNDDKITAENKYRLEGIYSTINHTFQTVGLPRMEDGSGALVFRDCGRARDFSLFGRIVNTLKRRHGSWIMFLCGVFVTVMILTVPMISMRKIC